MALKWPGSVLMAGAEEQTGRLRTAEGPDVAEGARMMDEGRWLNSWALQRYDAEEDPLGLVPDFARANRERYARIWGARGGA